MTTTNKTMTAEELWRMPPDDMRHELINGELKTMAPAGAEHGAIIIRLSRLLANHVEANQLGTMFGAETGFILKRAPDVVRAPDVSFIAKSRIRGELPKAYWPGAPDLAVEVLSPSDTVEEVEEKIGDCIDAGCPMVWVVNPKRKTVVVHSPRANPDVLHSADSLSGENVIPGFRCTVTQIFV